MNNTRKSGNYNNFSHALQVGSQGEAAFRELISRKEGYSFDDVTETEEFQKQDIDFIVTAAQTNYITVDVKTDTAMHKTENIVVETISNKDKERYKDGWFNTSAAEFWFFYDSVNEVFHAIKADEQRELYKSNDFRHHETRQQECNKFLKYAEIALIPLRQASKLPNYRKINMRGEAQ